jgi:phosphate transport system permease protein
VPSVIIGFLAALWFAPLLERQFVGFVLAVLLIPLFFVLLLLAWQGLRRQHWARHIECGHEFLVLAPLLVLAVAVALQLGPLLEGWLFGGNFKQWLFEQAGLRYDARNSIVISFALGFAVIPIIFTMAEDSLSNVPTSLRAASLALGASRWQTVWRVVLPSASPGIFAAVMIGLGRAVGETMIVLMATGNTPIMDLSLFNGMRPLSANIAVEIPEAPHGGTLYRVLFLSAVLLFLLTFVLNTVAELVRQRLRRRYGRF